MVALLSKRADECSERLVRTNCRGLLARAMIVCCWEGAKDEERTGGVDRRTGVALAANFLPLLPLPHISWHRRQRRPPWASRLPTALAKAQHTSTSKLIAPTRPAMFNQRQPATIPSLHSDVRLTTCRESRELPRGSRDADPSHFFTAFTFLRLLSPRSPSIAKAPSYASTWRRRRPTSTS